MLCVHSGHVVRVRPRTSSEIFPATEAERCVILFIQNTFIFTRCLGTRSVIRCHAYLYVCLLNISQYSSFPINGFHFFYLNSRSYISFFDLQSLSSKRFTCLKYQFVINTKASIGKHVFKDPEFGWEY